MKVSSMSDFTVMFQPNVQTLLSCSFEPTKYLENNDPNPGGDPAAGCSNPSSDLQKPP